MADSRKNYQEILGFKGVNSHRLDRMLYEERHLSSQNFIVDALRHEGPTGSHKEGCPAVIKDFYGNGD